MAGVDHVFDNVIKEHNLGNSNIEEELQIAAKLGNALLQQNNEITEKNNQLWSSNEEYKREIAMLRQQNNLLRKDAEIKTADQIHLDAKLTEMTKKVRSLEREMGELQSLLNSMSLSMSETEALCDQETMRANMLEMRLSELQLSQQDACPPSPNRCLSPTPLRERRNSHNQQLQNMLNRSENKRRGLEEEIKSLLEENCDLYKKIKTFEDLCDETHRNNRTSQLNLSTISSTTLDTTVESECDTDLNSLTSESWLAEKLAVLEERYNQACESCICGACDNPPDTKDGSTVQMSYRELFDQLFDALNTTKINTPYGTLKRRAAKKFDSKQETVESRFQSS